uniref:Uncharacterized protein n=1 Tax=viral metagenome TaxID=1070528 RepID=A0A6C0KUP4_9ZZZZ
MPKRSKATKSAVSTTTCTAFKNDNLITYPGVEEMYTIYTYSYIHDSESIYLFWEITNSQRMIEIEHVLSYYKQMYILESYSCDQVNLTYEAIKDLLIIMGHTRSMVTATEYAFIKPMLQTATIEYGVKIPFSFTTSDILAYVTFFGQTWYVPFFHSTELVCKPVPTHLPASALFSWYENELLNSSYSKKVIKGDSVQTDRYVECKMIWDRCEALISKESNQAIKMEVNSSSEKEEISSETSSPDSIPPKEDSEAILENEIVDINYNETINLYIQLYLEPSTQSELLLSEVYQNYKEKLNKYGVGITTQASFIKQLRSYDKFKITRHSRGMVITNYKIVTEPQFIQYMGFEDAFSTTHLKILSQFKSKFSSQCKSKDSIINFREAFFVLSTAMNIEPTYHSVLLYLHDPKTEAVINAYKPYIDALDEMNLPEVDPYNNHTLSNIFSKRSKIVSLISGITYYFPFSKEIIKINHTSANQKETYTGIYENSFTNGIADSTWCEYGDALVDVEDMPPLTFPIHIVTTVPNIPNPSRVESSYTYDKSTGKWSTNDKKLQWTNDYANKIDNPLTTTALPK